MTFYTRMQSTAARLLEKYGQSVTFSRTDGETHNPVTGAITGGTTTTITGDGVALPYEKGEIDDTNVLKTDVKMYFEATTTVPAVDDKCTLDSVEYRAVKVNPMSPAGTVVFYEIQLRV